MKVEEVIQLEYQKWHKAALERLRLERVMNVHFGYRIENDDGLEDLDLIPNNKKNTDLLNSGVVQSKEDLTENLNLWDVLVEIGDQILKISPHGWFEASKSLLLIDGHEEVEEIFREVDWFVSDDSFEVHRWILHKSHQSKSTISKLKSIIIDGSDWRRNTLLEMRSSSIDSVLFFYSGHGDGGEVYKIEFEPSDLEVHRKCMEKIMLQRKNSLSGKLEDLPLVLMLKELAWRVLEADFAGFEMGDGGSGTIRWDIIGDQFQINHSFNCVDELYVKAKF